jgi:Protein of unknown function (DUF998)
MGSPASPSASSIIITARMMTSWQPMQSVSATASTTLATHCPAQRASWPRTPDASWLGWEFVAGGQVPWPDSLARGPYGWAQVATFVVTGLLIVIPAVAVRDQLPRRRADNLAVVLLALLGVALMQA